MSDTLEGQYTILRIKNESLTRDLISKDERIFDLLIKLETLMWKNVLRKLPNHTEICEIAAWVEDNNPPFWRLSHAWYDGKSWIRLGGEDWTIQYWRESEGALGEQTKL